MTRAAPDPVFAAAAQEELERRVRAHRRRGARPRRRWVMEAYAIAGLAAIAAAIALGTASLHLLPDSGGAPAGAVTRTAPPAPVTTGPKSTSTTPTSTTPTGTPTPTPAPVTPTAPVTPPASSVSTPPPTSPVATTPPPTGTSALIGPVGAQRRSDAEIRAYAAGRGFSADWAQEGILDRDCMAAQGFLYDPLQGGVTPGGMSPSDAAAYEAALYGPPTDAPYDWRTAGCHGASVHETGNDHAN